MKYMWLLAGTMLAAAPAGAAPEQAGETASEQAFAQALANRDMRTAGRIHDRILEATAAGAGELRPNPVQSAAAGRFHLAAGAPQIALAYLDQAPVSALPQAQRAPTLLAHARAKAATGDRAGAEKTLGELLAGEAAAEHREAALVDLGRLLLAADPRRALSQIQPVLQSTDTARRLDALLVAVHGQALLGDRRQAADLARQAWALVPEAPAHRLAGIRLALASAALAAAAGDRDRTIAMLGLANPDSFSVEGWAGSVLPLCGEHGLRPDDFLTVTAIQEPSELVELVPVSASRPAAVAPFLDAFAGRTLLDSDRKAPGGTVLTLRCRTAPSAGFTSRPVARDPWHGWFAARGLHQPLSFEATDEGINALADRIDTLAGTLGADHPRLIPLRTVLGQIMAERAASGGEIQLWQITQLQQQVTAAMRRAGAGDLVPSEADEALHKRIAAARSPEEALPLIKEATFDYIRRAPIDAAEFSYRFLRENSLATPADKAAAAAALAERFANDPASPRARAVAVHLADLARERGDLTEMRRWHRKAGLSPGLCEASDETVQVQTQEISDQDFPVDAVNFGIPGLSQIELDAAADGTVTRHRLLIAAPAILFDGAIGEKIPTFRLSPPVFGGKAAACRGFVTRVVWRLPEKEEQDAPPVFQPGDPANS